MCVNKKIVKTSWKLIRYNIRTLLGFEILYKLLLGLLGIPLLLWLLQWSMDIHGYRYLDNASIASFLMEPTTLVILIGVCFLMTWFTMIEIHAVIMCYHASKNFQSLQILDLFYIGVQKACAMFKRKNAMLIIFVLCIIPLTNTAAVSGLITSIRIPEFIHSYIMNHSFLSFLFILIMLLCTLISIRWSLSLHVYTLKSYNFKEARRYSASLLKNNYLRTMYYVLLWQLVQFIFACFVIAFVSTIAIITIKLCMQDVVGYGMAIRGVSLIILVVNIVLLNASVPLSFALLSALFIHYQEEKECTFALPFHHVVVSQKGQRCFVIILVCLLVLGLYPSWDLQQRQANIIHELKEVPEITAHRGDSANAPENSIPAFQKAIQARADWIELDVHQTKDGVVVVTHDADLKRIAGVDKKIYDLRYAELQQYDVGSWFSPDYKGLQVATLDEVIALCKGKVKLNIELKPTGHEPDFEQHVIDLINKHGIKKDCVVSSLHKKALKTVKKLDESISTLYIMSVAIGDVSTITFADSVSVEASFITSDLLESIHRKGKKLTAWTVNQEENVKRMIDLGVDNIVTDNPSGVYKIIYENRTSTWIARLLSPYFI